MKKSVLLLVLSFLLSIIMFGQSGETSEMFEIDNNFGKLNEILDPFFENGVFDMEVLEFWRLDSVVRFGMIEIIDSVAYLKTILTYNEANRTIDSEYFKKIPDQDEEWKKDTRTLITLNNKNQQIQSILFIGYEEEWEAVERTDYTFNDDDKNEVTTVFHWNWNSSVWVNNNKTEFEYNSQGLVIEELHYNTDNETNNWKLFYKNDIVYNTNNEIIEYTRSNWNYQIAMWDNSYMYTYEYDDGIRSFYVYNWDSIHWTPISKNIGYRIDLYTIANDEYTYTGDTIWVHDYKSETRYDIYGNRIYYESYELNETSISWVGTHKSNYVYNESGKILMLISYRWRPTEGEWGLNRKMEYYYNDHGILYYLGTFGWNVDENIWIKNGSDISYFSNPSSIADYHANYAMIKINPNPSTNLITINYDTIVNQNAVYNIFTISGKVICKGITKQGNTINVSKLDAGYYVLKLEVGTKQYSGKFLKL